MRFHHLLLALAGAAALTGAERARRPIRYSDIPESLRPDVAPLGLDAPTFEASVRRLEQRTREREHEGENDHLIYYVLQSSRFTRQPRIEPALSARGFVLSLPSSEKDRYLANEGFVPPPERLPEPVAARIRDFLDSKANPDERLQYLRSFLRARAQAPGAADGYLYAHYARVMRFLYSKEFSAGSGTELATLYEQRGHSTDTQVEVNFAVYNALGALKGTDPVLRCHRVLIVGPGLDFAPRTDLVDVFPPQSYQPYAVADALIELGFASAGEIRIECVDINPRVIRFLSEFPGRSPPELALFTGVRETEERKFTEEFRSYFLGLGRSIGVERALEPVPPPLAGRLAKRLLVRPQIARRIRAERLDIVTERYHAPPDYDLAIVTNLLTYFAPPEVALALVNIASMLRDGGYLIHNDTRPVVLELASRSGLRPMECRTVLIAPGGDRALYDSACTLRRASR